MREAYRLQKTHLQNQLQEKEKRMSVFILYVGKVLPEYELVFEKTGVILTRLAKFIDDKT